MGKIYDHLIKIQINFKFPPKKDETLVMMQKIIYIFTQSAPPFDLKFLQNVEIKMIWPEEKIPEKFDLILWDHDLGSESFLNFPDNIRRKIVLFGTKITDQEMVTYFKSGISDVIRIPLKQEVFLALVENRLSIASPKSFKDLIKFNKEQAKIEIDQKTLHLTPMELNILDLFLENPNVVLDRDFFVKGIWAGVHVQSQNFDTHLSNLRKKLGNYSKHIETLKYRGHILKY